MAKDILATSQNIQNILKMKSLLEGVKEDSSKIREISLDNTGWEGLDAEAFNNSLKDFTTRLDKTATDIEESLILYKGKQEKQLEDSEKSAKTADKLDVMGLAGAAIGATLGGPIMGIPGFIAGSKIGYDIGNKLENTYFNPNTDNTDSEGRRQNKNSDLSEKVDQKSDNFAYNSKLTGF